MIACSLVLSWIESFIPLPLPVPGAKPGLSNIAVVLTLYLYGPGAAFLVDIGKVLLSGFMFGSLSSILYAASGAAFSLMVMIPLRKWTSLHMITVSMMGGIFHNIGQLAVAVAVLNTPALIYSYGPFLLAAGLTTGLLVGWISHLLYGRLYKLIG